jgi:hypothetical protein
MRVIPVLTQPLEGDLIFRAYKGSICDKESDEQKDVENTDEY